MKPKHFIEVDVECRAKGYNSALLDLDIKQPIEFRKATIFIDKIVGFYPDPDSGCFIELVNGDSFFTSLNYNELKPLIENRLI